MGQGDSGERSFVALMLGAELGGELRARLLPRLEELRREHPDALRVHGPADLHLTLAFLGQQPPEVCAEVVAALGPALARLPAPRLRLTRPGAFPGRDRERVLWAGVQDLSGVQLTDIAAAVREQCSACGVEIETRAFRPHVTLARVRAAARGRVPEAFFDDNPGLEWQPLRAHFVVSLGGGGPRLFRPGASFPLAPPGLECTPGPGTDGGA